MCICLIWYKLVHIVKSVLFTWGVVELVSISLKFGGLLNPTIGLVVNINFLIMFEKTHNTNIAFDTM